MPGTPTACSIYRYIFTDLNVREFLALFLENMGSVGINKAVVPSKNGHVTELSERISSVHEIN